MRKYETFTNYLKALWQLKGVLRNEWLKPKQLEVLQNKRLQILVKHAYEKVPYFRRLFDEADVKPEEIITAKDIEKIPVTTKDDLRELPVHDITALDANLNASWIRTTSGSTGIPLTVYRDNFCTIMFFCLNIRALKNAGASLTDKLLAIGPTFYPKDFLLQKIGVGRVKMLSPLKEPEELLMGINSYKPDILHCYPSVFKSITAYSKKTGEKIYRPHIVICIAEFLDNRTRNDIIDYFGSQPFQFYGSVEIGRVGSECSYRTGFVRKG